MPNKRNHAKDILLGVCLGDALGVPVEFEDRAFLTSSPVTTMIGYGTHQQPPGTWSDDGSMTLCLAQAMAEGFDLKRLAAYFIAWQSEAFWTANNKVFDIGITSSKAIRNLLNGISPELAGGTKEYDNGNGSLMRILPLVLLIKDKNIDERYDFTKQVSSLTHRHEISIVACFYYLEFARLVILGQSPIDAYQSLKETLGDFLGNVGIKGETIALFKRLLVDDIHTLNVDDIQSSGFVLHTLEASIWCILTTNDFSTAVLKAVNLGDDTDTTGAVAGGLAALIYGHESIPSEWLEVLARRKDIEELAETLNNALP